jgi:hypothetical protein
MDPKNEATVSDEVLEAAIVQCQQALGMGIDATSYTATFVLSLARELRALRARVSELEQVAAEAVSVIRPKYLADIHQRNLDAALGKKGQTNG